MMVKRIGRFFSGMIEEYRFRRFLEVSTALRNLPHQQGTIHQIQRYTVMGNKPKGSTLDFLRIMVADTNNLQARLDRYVKQGLLSVGVAPAQHTKGVMLTVYRVRPDADKGIPNATF